MLLYSTNNTSRRLTIFFCGDCLLLLLLYSDIVWNVFVKPKDQKKLVCFGLARKGRMKSNVFVKPKEQSQV